MKRRGEGRPDGRLSGLPSRPEASPSGRHGAITERRRGGNRRVGREPSTWGRVSNRRRSGQGRSLGSPGVADGRVSGRPHDTGTELDWGSGVPTYEGWTERGRADNLKGSDIDDHGGLCRPVDSGFHGPSRTLRHPVASGVARGVGSGPSRAGPAGNVRRAQDRQSTSLPRDFVPAATGAYGR